MKYQTQICLLFVMAFMGPLEPSDDPTPAAVTPTTKVEGLGEQGNSLPCTACALGNQKTVFEGQKAGGGAPDGDVGAKNVKE